MKYDFQKQELKWQKFWKKEKIYDFKNQGKIFSIDTDPPTLSGKMHIGHISSYTHEDIIARYKRMAGFNVFFPFGVDNNGLPTAKLVEKENKIRFFDIKRNKFLKLCNQTIKKVLPQFISAWQRIGISCDFINTYSTISPEVQKLSQELFLDLIKKKRVYQKEAPCLWCPECKTAIAQAELQDKNIETDFCDIQFELENGKKILIATTRPELLSSCVAVFVNPNDKRHKKLIGKTAIVPLSKQKVKILADKAVDMEKGTGIVMCCTFGDTQDIEWFFKHKLPLKVSITKDGKIFGLPVKQARKKIIQDLESKGLIKSKRKIFHTVNIHERCSTPIEILSTKQWFVKYLDLKKEFLAQSKKLNWYPPFMRTRLDNWIKNLKWDWCISRQRYFGIPIPVWYCKNCGRVIMPDKKDLPIDPMHTKPKKKCVCGSNDFIPETDVLDTWATSSLTPQITKAKIPMSLRPQAHDIINFWLFYTLARSYLHFKKLPFKDVFISGFVLDAKGEKMSKSKDNAIEPEELLKNYGADAIRFWAAQAGMGEDIRYSEEEIKTGKRTVTKIWNASHFCLMHLKNYSLKKAVELQDEDKWIFTKLFTTIENYKKQMDKYEYQRAKETIDNFFWHDFCDNYLEVIKFRVYDEGTEKKSLQAVQFTLYNMLLSVLKLYAPIMPFITEEIYQAYFRKFEKERSIHLTLLPKADKKLCFSKIAKDFEFVIDAIAQIRKYKSEHHLSMKAEVESIKIKSNLKIKKYLPFLSKLMSVKEIRID